MQQENDQAEGNIQKGRGVAAAREPFSRQSLQWATRVWRPAGSVIAVGLALLLAWHVVNGKHGLSVWQQKRVEHRQLQREIDDLKQENEHIRQHVEKLKSDPHAIEREARENLHYAKPGEVIYALPPDPPAETIGAMQRGDAQGSQNVQNDKAAAAPEAFSKRALQWAMRIWRPAGTVVAVGLALLLAWHVVSGKHGLSVWQQKRVEGK